MALVTSANSAWHGTCLDVFEPLRASRCLILPYCSHTKQIHLDAIFEDVKKALEIELGISATTQRLLLDNRIVTQR